MEKIFEFVANPLLILVLGEANTLLLSPSRKKNTLSNQSISDFFPSAQLTKRQRLVVVGSAEREMCRCAGVRPLSCCLFLSAVVVEVQPSSSQAKRSCIFCCCVLCLKPHNQTDTRRCVSAPSHITQPVDVAVPPTTGTAPPCPPRFYNGPTRETKKEKKRKRSQPNPT